MRRALLALLRRELLLAWRRRADLLTLLAFYVAVCALFPLANSAEAATLQAHGAGVIWAAALLASLLGVARMFASDAADGSLALLLLGPIPPSLIALTKMAAHWLLNGLPLALAAPVLATVLFRIDGQAAGWLLASLLLGTPVLSLLGGVGAALALGERSNSALVAVLILPLYIPAMIFGTAAVAAYQNGADPTAHLLLLGAVLAASLALAPVACASALRIAVE